MIKNYRLLIAVISVGFLFIVAQFFQGGHHFMMPILSSLFGFCALYFLSSSFLVDKNVGETGDSGQKKFIGPFNSPITIIFGSFLLWSVICMAFAPYFFGALSGTMMWFGFFIMYLAGWYVVAYDKSFDQTTKLCRLFLGGAFLILIVAYIFFFIAEPVGYVRLFGIYLDHNAFGGYMIFATFLFLATFLSTKNKPKGYIIWLATLSSASIGALILTFSRGTFVAVLFGCIVAILGAKNYLKTEKEFKVFAKKMAVVLILGGLIAWGAFLIRQSQLAKLNIDAGVYKFESAEISGLTFRLGYIDNTVSVAKDNWLFGVGLGNYHNSQLKYLDQKEFFSFDPHNMYALVLAETGFIGAIIFGLFFIYLFIFIFKNCVIKNCLESTGNIYVPAIVLSVVSFCIHATSAPDIYHPALMFIFFIFLGIGTSHLTQAQVSTTRKKFFSKKSEDLILKFLIILSALIFILNIFIFLCEEKVRDGDYFHQEGKIELALETYQKWIKLNPFDSENHARIGNVYRDLGQYQLAIENIEKAIKLDPEMHIHYSDLSYVYKLIGDAENEIKYLEKSIEKNKTSPIGVYERLATIYAEQGRVEDAIKTIEYAEAVFGRYVAIDFSGGDPAKPSIIETLERMKKMKVEFSSL